MISPIIIDDHGDVEFYAKSEDAKQDLEVVDVQNQEFNAYDCQGQEICLEARLGRNRRFQILLRPTGRYKPLELQTLLAHFFVEVTNDAKFHSYSLEKLISFGVAFFKIDQGIKGQGQNDGKSNERRDGENDEQHGDQA